LHASCSAGKEQLLGVGSRASATGNSDTGGFSTSLLNNMYTTYLNAVSTGVFSSHAQLYLGKCVVLGYPIPSWPVMGWNDGANDGKKEVA